MDRAKKKGGFTQRKDSLLKRGSLGLGNATSQSNILENALEHLVLGTACVTGEDFFVTLVSHLALALEGQYALITEFRTGSRLFSLAYWARGIIQPNSSFRLEDFPTSAIVVQPGECYYTTDLGDDRQGLFLTLLPVSTYLGTVLTDLQGNTLGTLCLLNDRPLKNAEQAQQIFRIFAARASAELSRLKAEKALQRAHARLDSLVEKSAQLLIESQDRFECIVRNVPGAVYQFAITPNQQFHLMYMSNQIGNLLGLKAKELEEDVSLIINRIHPDDRADFDQSVADSAQTLNPWLWDGRVQHINGNYRWLRGMSQPHLHPDGTIVWDGVLVDIHDRKEAEENIQNSLQKQEELNEMRFRLINTASHELRTPLAIIGSSASILRRFSDRLDSTQQLKHLQTIETYVQHMTRLLEDLLILNRMNTGRLSFEPKTVNLIEFCSSLVDELYWSSNEHPMIFHTEFEGVEKETEAATGRVDVKLLRQILTNLISNAVKYSEPESPIKIILKLTPNQLILQVKDSGIGIAEPEQAVLFEPFYRGKNVGIRSGSGLGLSVVKNCVDLHQGTIAIVSHLGAGSTFTVVLPRSP